MLGRGGEVRKEKDMGKLGVRLEKRLEMESRLSPLEKAKREQWL